MPTSNILHATFDPDLLTRLREMPEILPDCRYGVYYDCEKG